jgi:hypothetical protein
MLPVTSILAVIATRALLIHLVKFFKSETLKIVF